MKSSKANLNQERAILAAVHSVSSPQDALRELVLNSRDAIADAAKGRIEIRVGEAAVSVLDNGYGCINHEKFTAIRNPSDPSRTISYEGIGLKTNFQFFDRIDILSRDAVTGQILRICNFRLSEDPASIYPPYEYEVLTTDDPIYGKMVEELGDFNTKVTVSKPKAEVDLTVLFLEDKRGYAASHIIHVANEPVHFLANGGQISVVKPGGERLEAQGNAFSTGGTIISFSSNEQKDLYGKTIAPIFTETPERAVRISVAVSKTSLEGKGFMDIYLGDSRICSSIQEYVRAYLGNLRQGSLAHLQVRVELSQWWKENYRLNHNKHNLKDDPVLQQYLAKVLKACEAQIREVTKAAPRKAMNPKHTVAQIRNLANKLLKSFDGKNTATTKKCMELVACIEELGVKVGLKKEA